jgi:hypothetical protein
MGRGYEYIVHVEKEKTYLAKARQAFSIGGPYIQPRNY